jgi:hypothetical protein
MKWRCNVCDAINLEKYNKCWNCGLFKTGNEAIMPDITLDFRGKKSKEILEELDKINKKTEDKKKWN